MFERGGQLWVVFPGADASVAGWRSLDRPEVTAWLEPIATTGAGARACSAFACLGRCGSSRGPTASGWSIVVTPAGGEPPAARPGVRLAARAGPGALTVETEGEVVQLRDPDSGERLGVR